MADLYLELVREYVHELCAVAVLAADNLLLGLVVIAARQEVAENQLWHPDLVLGVVFNRNALAVVLDADG